MKAASEVTGKRLEITYLAKDLESISLQEAAPPVFRLNKCHHRTHMVWTTGTQECQVGQVDPDLIQVMLILDKLKQMHDFRAGLFATM